jgi:hypothetical protein
VGTCKRGKATREEGRDDYLSLVVSSDTEVIEFDRSLSGDEPRAKSEETLALEVMGVRRPIDLWFGVLGRVASGETRRGVLGVDRL